VSPAVTRRILELEQSSRTTDDGLVGAEEMQALAYLYELRHNDIPAEQAGRRRRLVRAVAA
jgi:hypothetical protein